MLKSKLMAIIGVSTSVVVAATTALTLAISGPRNVLSLSALSDNDAVAYGVSDLFSSAANGVDTVTNVINTISENKAELAVGLTINELEDLDEALYGMGADLKVQFDVENQQYAISGSASYGSVELINALLYMDEKEMIAYVPSLFEGIVKIGYDNLAENLENSYIGSILEEEGFDYEAYREELEAVLNEAATSMPAFDYDFDYEDFVDGLNDTINNAYLEATKSMDVTDNGKQPLNGGKYQCYTASISVAELSNILKEALVYVLESEDFLDYLDYIAEYYQNYESSLYGDYEDYEDYEDYYGSLSLSESLAGVSSMIDSYWGMITSELEAVLGKNIEFTIYLTDAVETAGFELYISPNADGSLNYSKSAANAAETAIIIKGDFTGGKEIGDYTYLKFAGTSYGTDAMVGEYSFKMEENGDFTLDISASEYGASLGLFHADGSYTENDMFFSLDVDSFKFVDESGKTTFDIGFNLSFEPIDGVDKPSSSVEYDIWKMDEADFEELANEILENIEKINDTVN